MKRIAVLFSFLLALQTPAAAQLTMTGVGGGFGPAGGGGYTGPGDVVASAKIWYGLRCYNAAYTGNVVDITDSATGNTTGTRLQCAAGGTISALVSGSACTFVTGNACSSLATTCATACNVRQLYDQTAGNQCAGASCDLIASVNANRPTYTQNCLGSLPCMTFVNGVTHVLQTANSFTAIAQPYTASWVGNRTGGFTTFSPVWTDFNASTGGWNNAANQIVMYAGTSATKAATDSTTHATQSAFNGASSTLYVDGSSSTVNPGTSGSTTNILAMGNNLSGQSVTGNIFEFGIWPIAFSGGQNSSMNSNQHTYWGF